MVTKVCTKCGRELPLDQFSKQAKAKDGKRSQCKECDLEYQRKKYEERRLSRTNNTAFSKLYSNIELAKFTPRQLIEELKARGYRGTLTIEQKVQL